MDRIAARDEVRSAHEHVAALGARPSLIEAFGIRGLYGYRNISLESEYAATILIARNGTGKTTLLGALDAFLRMQLNRLRNLEFSEIFCKIRGFDHELTLSKDELSGFFEVPKTDEFLKLASRISSTPENLFQFLLGDYRYGLENYVELSQESPASLIMRLFGYNTRKAQRECDAAYASLFKRSENIAHIKNAMEVALDGIEIVYLPTYRRVEIALTDDGENRLRRRRRNKPKIRVAAGSLYTADIQFGLSDITDRLDELNREIVIRSNLGYREISENIIHELIGGYNVPEGRPVPSADELKLFFSRLESGSNIIAPSSRFNAPDFESFYSKTSIPTDALKFLNYFLGKLYDVIKITKEIERPVGLFIDSCNKYLSTTEPTTWITGEKAHHESFMLDAKALRMNPTNLSVDVESLRSGRPMGIDALSSGEKQMISLFAKMYLYPKSKIVLIDEPELSLSIDWQRGILTDVLAAPSCEQVISITHSPFVFDNALEPFARTLSLSFEKEPDWELYFDDLDEDGDPVLGANMHD